MPPHDDRMLQEDFAVCKMLPSGEVVCNDLAVIDYNGIDDDHLRGAIADATSRLGRGYSELALAILETLVAASGSLPDSKLPYRRQEIVGAVRDLLEPGQPPSLLAFHFSTQPGDVFGAFHMNKGDLVWMRQDLDTFKAAKPVPPGPPDAA